MARTRHQHVSVPMSLCIGSANNQYSNQNNAHVMAPIFQFCSVPCHTALPLMCLVHGLAFLNDKAHALCSQCTASYISLQCVLV